jgi:hypothetical protein
MDEPGIAVGKGVCAQLVVAGLLSGSVVDRHTYIIGQSPRDVPELDSRGFSRGSGGTPCRRRSGVPPAARD